MGLDLTPHELLVISDTPTRDKPGEGKKIRVVLWIKGAGTVAVKSISVKIEVGKYKPDLVNGGTRFFCGSLGLQEVNALSPHMPQIRAWMASPPPVPREYMEPSLRAALEKKEAAALGQPPAAPEESW